MVRHKPSFRISDTAALAAIAIVLASAPSQSRGDDVLPPTAKPKGYSLAKMADITAFFNTGPRVPGSEPATPFQILYTPLEGDTPVFTVSQGTMFYLPLVYSDDSPPIIGDLPADVDDQPAVATYYFDPDELGATMLQVEVDGRVSTFGPGYAVGAATPLADGGTRYTTVAAFLAPLPPGAHTVTIRALFDGAALAAFPDFFPDGIWEFETTYQVVVR
jgi:hypothetical protein